MPKPILSIHYCVDGLPSEVIVKNLKNVSELAKQVAGEDYYVFVFPTREDSHLEVFFDKDIEDCHYQEMYERLLTEMQNIK